MQKRIAILSLVLGLLVFSGMAIQVSDAAGADVIKARQGLFKQMNAASKVIRKNLKGDFDTKTIDVELAKMLANVKLLSSAFDDPNPVSDSKTRAKPEIWSNKDKFDMNFSNLAARLESAGKHNLAGNKQKLSEEFSAALKVCSACHSKFRAKK